jgi:tRNA-2-methylthio-N6-dimethylallyladenosine synthase
VVPSTRGRERSREPQSIVRETIDLVNNGYKEVTLLGQNVDSYLWSGGGLKKESYTEEEIKEAVTFYQLLEMVAIAAPTIRIRFSTSHPKDLNNSVIETIKKYDNICNYIHLPVQSGSSKVLEMMNRGYTREWYLERINKIREIIPDCGISTDIMTGFCDETEEDHQETLSLIEESKFNFAYMYSYSERPKTLAERKFKDNVLPEIKSRRLSEIIVQQSAVSLKSNKEDIGKTFKVLVEGVSKKSEEYLSGRTDQN